MKTMKKVGWAHATLMLLLLTVAAKPLYAEPPQEAEKKSEERIVIAALPFADSSPGGKYAPLAESMGDMIAVCLGRAEGLTFVERKELNKVFKEHKLTLAGLVDSETKVKVGRLLGAKYILTGGVTVVNKKLKINAHLFEVETTRLVRSEAAEGEIDKLFSVVAALAEKLASDLNIELPKITEEDIDKSPEAGLHFMRGLGYYYGNMLDHAIAEFMKTLALDPRYSKARYWNAQCYFDEEEWQHAKIEYERFLKDFPEDQLAPKVKQKLKRCEEEMAKKPQEN